MRNNGVELLGEIGRGARSVVYRARKADATLAVKIQQNSSEPGMGGYSWFWREAAALARVTHPSVPTVLAAGEAGQKNYIILEFVEGSTLSALLEAGPLGLAQVLDFGTQLVEALVAVHDRFLVHRDIKPGNVLVSNEGRVKLIDFGFAAGLRERKESSDFFAGTLAYCAPEQCGMLKRPVDGRSDLYSLGCVVFEALTGRPPFRATDPGELMRCHAVEPPPDVRLFRPEASSAVAAVLARCMAKDPDDRFQSARELLSVLRSWAEPSKRIAIEASPRERLVGREVELEFLGRLAQEADQGHGAAAFVLGGAGDGKSRLLAEALAPGAHVRRSIPVLSGKCVAGEAAPFSILRAALTNHVEELRALPGPARTQAQERLGKVAGDALPLLVHLCPALSKFLEAPSANVQSLESHSQLYEVLGTFLTAFVTAHGGAVLCIDDLQWVDEASYQVLVRVGSKLRSLPFLVLASVRSECEQDAYVTTLRDVFDAHMLRLPPLNDEQVAELIGERLGSRVVPPRVAQALAVRSGGNPFAVEEYLNALLDRGFLRPAWGSWILDGDNLDSLALPADVVELVLSRTESVGPESHGLLTLAALLGTRFRATRLAWVAEVEPNVVEVALTEAARASLVTHIGADQFALIHDRVRDALLEQLSPEQRARDDFRVAERLREAPDLEAAEIYAVAEHYMRAWAGGVRGVNVQAAVGLAGETAMQQYLFERALRYFRWLGQIADELPFAVLRRHGEAAHKSGDADEAIAVLGRALAICHDPLEEAGIHLEVSRAYMGRMDLVASTQALELGIRALGQRPLRYSPAALASAVVRATKAVGMLLARLLSGRPFVPPTGVELERTRLMIALVQQLGYVAHFSMDTRLRTLAALNLIPYSCRLGPARETSAACAALAAAVAIMGKVKLSRRLVSLGKRLALSAQDPVAQATVDFYAALAIHFSGDAIAGQEAMASTIRWRGAWLEPKDFLSGVADGAWNCILRGYAREGWQLLELGFQRSALGGVSDHALQGHSYRSYGGSALAMLGRGSEGAVHLDEFQKQLRDPAADRWRWGQFYGHLVLHLVELGEVGRPLEEAITRQASLGLPLKNVPLHLKGFYVGVAYGRLRQLGEGAPVSPQAVEAVAWLKQVATHPTLKAHFFAASGLLALAQGRLTDAERDWTEAESLAQTHDNPWALFESCCGRSRLLARRGLAAASARQARQALALAQEHGWVLRARRVRQELGLSSSGPSASRSLAAQSQGMHLRRHLDALLQVSLASTSVLEPAEQARAILDVLLRLFGAERAFLCLQEQPGLAPQAVAARTSQGEDIEALDGFSRTVVEQVFRDQQALTVNTEQEAEDLGSRSIVTQDLRSVMAVPVKVRERILGVVYLDSRLARGVFAAKDVDILLAIASHIGVGVETARSAQLQLQVREEQAQRTLAESLRAVSSALNASLDLREVLQRVLEGLQTLVGYERAEVLMLEKDLLRVAASAGSPAGGGLGASSRATGMQPREVGLLVHSPQRPDPVLAGVLNSVVPILLDNNLPAYVEGNSAEVWLGVPLWVRDTAVGALALERSEGGFDERTRGIVSMFAVQASLAIQNALLFAEVHVQATVDPLTRTYNRREVMRLAEQVQRLSHRHRRPFVVAMLDVDYFKKVNDTYGHPTGDAVLVCIAGRLRATLRDVDLVGRYGGEEFLLILPESNLQEGLVACERVRMAIAAHPIPTDHGDLPVSASVGVCGVESGATDLAQLIATADTALYQAKQNGRNRVECSGGDGIAVHSLTRT